MRLPHIGVRLTFLEFFINILGRILRGKLKENTSDTSGIKKLIMEYNYLVHSEQYYKLEWLRQGMDSKLSEYKVKTKFSLDYSEFQNKIDIVSKTQTYLTELYESARIESKRNFDLEHLLFS